jgi:predicted dehydrogenase
MKRREFIRRVAQGTALVSTTALSAEKVLGANEKVRIGVIGFGLMGRIHTRNFHALPDAQVVAVADTHQSRLEAAGQLVGSGCKLYRDFRRLLEDKSIDGVVVATPDHWHALITMLACAAGKDVYVEKPLTLFAREGRWMIDVARRTKRVVQVGTQQRSGAHYQRARELIRGGRIGQLVSVQCNFFRNVAPGFGNPPDSDPPPELDYDLWLGPAPQRDYNPNRAIYHFRWFWDYAGGQMTNLGHHSLDIVHWCMGIKGARAIASAGGRWFLKDNCEAPDVQDVLIEYPGFNATVQIRECAACGVTPNTGGLTFHGTKATLVVNRTGFEVIADKKENPVNIVSRIMGGHPVGGPQPMPEKGDEFWTESATDKSGDAKNQVVEHARNFIQCVKSRQQPNSDLESSHQVSTVCHLANIAMKVSRKIRWDTEREDIVGDPEAAAMLTRPYRKPWHAELRALGVS